MYDKSYVFAKMTNFRTIYMYFYFIGKQARQEQKKMKK